HHGRMTIKGKTVSRIVLGCALGAGIASATVVTASPSAAQELTNVSVASGTLVGAYFAPADGKRHPAIVVLGGSEGGLHPADARMFAQHGYAALALAYFGVDPLP